MKYLSFIFAMIILIVVAGCNTSRVTKKEKDTENLLLKVRFEEYFSNLQKQLDRMSRQTDSIVEKETEFFVYDSSGNVAQHEKTVNKERYQGTAATQRNIDKVDADSHIAANDSILQHEHQSKVEKSVYDPPWNNSIALIVFCLIMIIYIKTRK